MIRKFLPRQANDLSMSEKKSDKKKKFVKPVITNDHEHLDVKSIIEAELPWLTPGAVRNLVMRRKIPFRKCSGRLIFLRREIREWVQFSEGLTFDEFKKRNGI